MNHHTGYSELWSRLSPTVVTPEHTYERAPPGLRPHHEFVTVSVLGPHDADGEVSAIWLVLARSDGALVGTRLVSTVVKFLRVDPESPEAPPRVNVSALAESLESFLGRRASDQSLPKTG